MDLSYLEEPIEVHKAQDMCYAYIYGSQSGKDKIQVQMTYCQMESEEIKRFTEDFTIERLKKWFEDLLGAYYKWAKFQYDRRILRRKFHGRAGVSLSLPAGAAGTGHRGISHHHHRQTAFHPGPYRIGKTMAAVFSCCPGSGAGIRR